MTGQGNDLRSDGERVRVPIIRDGLATHLPDTDPAETAEWLESFDAVLGTAGQQRARYLMLRMLQRARERHVGVPSLTSTDYVNTIPTDREPWFPGDEEAERAYRRWIRWNAAITVHRAQRPGIGVGGHISSYASSATLYEVGFNHFFRGKDHPGGGDQVFIQGHASPGIYARAYLEGRLSEDRLDGFRQELSHGGPGRGLPSYPHPRLMPDFWEFPTVSMGLGPMNAIMQARFNRYLGARGFTDTSDQHVWAFLGDGEMDEPESRGLIHIAAGEGLDNLTFVVNCNLQRLDGPVRGNGKIIQELESFFRGAGWNVIKVIWGREWDALLHADRDGALVNLMNTTPDGDYQTYKANDGAFVREHFFGRDPRTKALVEPMSDAEIWNLKRGGHDYRKVYAAYSAATAHHGQPTVILAKTIKGYGLGAHFAGRNATHQMKKLTLDDLKAFRDSQRIPISDKQLEENPYLPPYYHPGEHAPEIRYMHERRARLGGAVPERRVTAKPLVLPGDKVYEVVRRGSGKQEVATTMAFVRLLRELVKDKEIGGAVRADHPGRGADVRDGLDVPDAEDLQPARAALHVGRRQPHARLQGERDRAAPARGDRRGRLDGVVHRGGQLVRHARRADDPGLRLLLDVRLPAHRRLDLGGGGPDGPRLPHRRDGRADDADGRGPAAQRRPLAAARGDEPRGRRLRPRRSPTRSAHIVKDGLRRMYGGESDVLEGENVIYYLTVYNEPYVQPAEPDDLDVDGLLRGHLPLPGRRARRRAAGPAARLGRRAAVGGAGAPECSPSSGAWGPRCGR